ncbi:MULTISPECIES: trypsin-like serine protease [unclassified Arthrobacter]|uniref:S1 family peptidase n=1 Tax=unclassified Arthrobacter TaxID=235627 RepID=UPI000CE40FEC|nr:MULTISPECIES: trypsin-like serine protease [unclassified Arthrobacter]
MNRALRKASIIRNPFFRGWYWLLAVLFVAVSCSQPGGGAEALAVKSAAPAASPVAEAAARVVLINHSSPADDYYSGHFCGAVLIEADLIATVSHCVEGKDASIIDAVIGAGNLCKGSQIPGERLRVTSIRVPAPPHQEIAFLRLASASSAQPVALTAAQPVRGISVGWGSLSDGGTPPCEVKSTEQQTVSSAECDQYAEAVGSYSAGGDTYLCALPSAGTRLNTCQGDSGGPLITAVAGQELVYALTLGGGSCRVDSPGLYVTAAAVAAAALPPGN